MNFWSWLNDRYQEGSSEYWKRIIAAFVVFVLIPALIYVLLVWNPVIGTDEDGEPTTLAIYLVFALYWFALYIDYKRYEARTRLDELLDKVFSEDDAQFERTLELIKDKREVIKNDEIGDYRNEGEERIKWFGIK